MKNMLLILIAAFMGTNTAYAVQFGTYTWDKSEFGIKFTVVGPYVFFADKTDIEKKTGSVVFMREGKGKRGVAYFAPLKKVDQPLDKVSIQQDRQLASLANIKTESRKSIKAGKTPAILIVFSYDEPGPKPIKRGMGYFVVSDLNNFRYSVWVLNMAGNDPVQDKELGGIIKTLEITEVQ